MSRVPNLSYINIDDFFKDGDILYDKTSDMIFKYSRKKHFNSVRTSPNNYRIAHKGDISQCKNKK